jgi:hypothetical protein
MGEKRDRKEEQQALDRDQADLAKDQLRGDHEQRDLDYQQAATDADAGRMRREEMRSEGADAEEFEHEHSAHGRRQLAQDSQQNARDFDQDEIDGRQRDQEVTQREHDQRGTDEEHADEGTIRRQRQMKGEDRGEALRIREEARAARDEG